jgi:hypothetical protein
MKINLIAALFCGGLLFAAPATGAAANGPVGGSEVHDDSIPAATKSVGGYKGWRARRLQRLQKQKAGKAGPAGSSQ